MRNLRTSHLVLCGMSVFIVLVLSSPARSIDWQGAGTGGNTATDPSDNTTQWSVSGNWSGASLPGPSDTANFNFANAGAAYATTATVDTVYVQGSTDQAALHIGTGVDLSITSAMRIGSGVDSVTGKVVQDGGTVTIEGASYGGLWVGYYWDDPAGTGYYDLSGTGQLTVKTSTVVGHSGATGVFTQSGGTHTTRGMRIGTGSGSTGIYTLSGGTLEMSDLDADGAWCTIGVGSSGGTGTFIHTGGEVDLDGENDYGSISVGRYEETTGNTYTLSGTGVITGPERGYIRVGDHADATGTFTQTGGAVDVYSVGVGMGSDNSLYEMSGSAQLTTNGTTVGSTSSGTFTQSAGTHTVYQLRVGSSGNTDGDGTYNLSGTGQLVVQPLEGGSWTAAYIGGQGTGTFTQSGGTHTGRWLFVGGHDASGEGTYLLSDGELSVLNEYAGRSNSGRGPGLLDQSGGTNTASSLRIGPDGTYRYTGGTLNAGSITIRGDFDFDNSNVTLSMPSGILDVSEGTFSNAGSAGLVIGEEAVLIVAEGYDPADFFATYTNNGWTHITGTDLAIGPGESLSGSGTIKTETLTNSGELAPGSSAGILEIIGDYVQETVGDLLVEIGGYSHWSAEGGTTYDYDRLEITGEAALEGIIEVSLIDGFAPLYGDTFDVLLADNGITIGAGGLTLTGDDFSWSLTDGDTTLQLEYTAIPEPTTMTLLALGVGIICTRLRSRSVRAGKRA